MADVLLFACGSFQELDVQFQVFGRRLSGSPEDLPGYAWIPNGQGDLIVTRTGNQADKVAGTAYSVSPEDLDVAESTEPPAYVRTEVTLASGRTAWAFLKTW